MNKNQKNIYQIIDIPEYDGATIYALVDKNGKRYIGSTIHLRSRIKQHNTYMRVAIKEGHSGFLNPKIERAVLNGAKFRCEILAKIYCKTTKHELEEMERIFLRHYGGIDNTYNYIPIKHRV